MLVTVSVTGKVSQNQLRPMRENAYPSGTNSTTVRMTVSAELFRLEPTAWKNTGNVSDVTSGRKLTPMMRKATRPISMTASSELNARSIWVGISSKHSVPRAISAIPKQTEAQSVFLHRSMLREA